MENIKDRPHTAGMRTTLRSIEAGSALRVFIAEDADVFVRRRVQEASTEKGVPCEYVSSMKELGENSGLSIKTAGAALLKA